MSRKELAAKNKISNFRDNADIALSEILWIMREKSTIFISTDTYNTYNLKFKSIATFKQSVYQEIKHRLELVTAAPNGITLGTSRGRNYSFHITISFNTALASTSFLEKFDIELLRNIRGSIWKLTKYDLSVLDYKEK